MHFWARRWAVVADERKEGHLSTRAGQTRGNGADNDKMKRPGTIEVRARLTGRLQGRQKEEDRALQWTTAKKIQRRETAGQTTEKWLRHRKSAETLECNLGRATCL